MELVIFVIGALLGFIVGVLFVSVRHEQQRIIDTTPIYDQMKKKYGEGFLDD